MSESGSVTVEIKAGVGGIRFHHPKGNSLPGDLLRHLTRSVDDLATSPNVKVVTLGSRGEGTFCAGASFDEMAALKDEAGACRYFMGFGRLILAMKRCPKFIVTRVQGRAVGGGVGVIAASDYVVAHEEASLKLSEYALGIGPFVIGPAVERKIGLAAFAEASIDTRWRPASWAAERGLYSQVLATLEELDRARDSLAARLASTSPEATAALKSVLWQSTDDWDELLARRAEISGRLVLSDFTSRAIAAFRKPRS